MLMALAGVIPAIGLLATTGFVLWAIRRDGRQGTDRRARIDGSGSAAE